MLKCDTSFAAKNQKKHSEFRSKFMKRRKSRKGEREKEGYLGYSRNLRLINCVEKITSFEACFENNERIG